MRAFFCFYWSFSPLGAEVFPQLVITYREHLVFGRDSRI